MRATSFVKVGAAAVCADAIYGHPITAAAKTRLPTRFHIVVMSRTP
jgi:hypothetical protein